MHKNSATAMKKKSYTEIRKEKQFFWDGKRNQFNALRVHTNLLDLYFSVRTVKNEKLRKYVLLKW